MNAQMNDSLNAMTDRHKRELLQITRELKSLRKIAALCQKEINQGRDLPAELFDAVTRYTKSKIAAQESKSRDHSDDSVEP